jgi:hypothetical protein
LLKFDELTILMVPTIAAHARFTNESFIVTSWPTKLSLKQQLF